MKIRITLEYDTDGATLEEEKQDWIDGSVGFVDLWLSLGGDDDIVIKFEAV